MRSDGLKKRLIEDLIVVLADHGYRGRRDGRFTKSLSNDIVASINFCSVPLRGERLLGLEPSVWIRYEPVERVIEEIVAIRGGYTIGTLLCYLGPSRSGSTADWWFSLDDERANERAFRELEHDLVAHAIQFHLAHRDPVAVLAALEGEYGLPQRRLLARPLMNAFVGGRDAALGSLAVSFATLAARGEDDPVTRKLLPELEAVKQWLDVNQAAYPRRG